MRISNKRPRFSESSVKSALHTETRFKLYNNTDLYNHAQWNMSGTVNNNAHTAARQTPASNHHRDSLELVLGESTPNVLAPGDPTRKDHDWPRLLADCLERLISAWRETAQCPRGTSSLPGPATAEASAVTGDPQIGSEPNNNCGSRKRDLHGRHTVAPNTTPIHRVRAGDLHDISADHSPGDPEMPRTVTSSNHKVLIDTDNRGHSDRQSPSPLTTWPTQQGSPPDEDVMPKRVADGRRYQHHTSTDNDNNVTQFEQNQQDKASHTKVTVTRTTTQFSTVMQQRSQTSSLNPRHRAGRDNPDLGTPSTVPEETLDNPAGPLAITIPIALADDKPSASSTSPPLLAMGDENTMTTMPTGSTTLIIKNMNAQLYKLTYKLYYTRSHKIQAVQAIHVHPSILKFRPMFMATNPSEIDAHIQWTAEPLEQCIHRHYQDSTKRKKWTTINV